MRNTRDDGDDEPHPDSALNGVELVPPFGDLLDLVLDSVHRLRHASL